MLPTNVEFKIRNIHSAPVAENYCAGIEMAIKEGCTHVLTCEDDQVLEEDSIIRLFDFALKNPDCCV
jgi:GT2 family glycosyltransferase